MKFEQPGHEQPYQRLSDPELLKSVREDFADLLEDRASDPSREGGASQTLADFAEKIRSGEKIARTSAALTIFRGVFSVDSKLRERGIKISQGEIDKLEETYFET